MLLELRKMMEEEYLPAFWQLVDQVDYQPWMVVHLRAAIYGVLFTIFGLIVLSFEYNQPKPGTGVIRDKIFGIDQRYFLVYLNGLLLYICWVFIMEDEIIPEEKEDTSWFSLLNVGSIF